MTWSNIIRSGEHRVLAAVQELAGDLRLLLDITQLNRRTRLAWQQGRNTRACYLLMDHQRRRITRRREIRRLVEG